MLDFLAYERGYTREQAYVLASVAVDLRISEAEKTRKCGPSGKRSAPA